MEIMQRFFLDETVEVFFPPEEIESWNLLKKRYNQSGYYWSDFSLEPSLKKAKKLDKKNLQKYRKMKKKELKMRRSFRGIKNITVIHPPATPTNEERFRKLQKWSEHNYYNITMITIYLYTHYNLKPCRDYEPDNLLEVYNKYSSKHIENIPSPLPIRNNYLEDQQVIRRESCTFNSPSAPPPLPPPPLRNNYLEHQEVMRRDSYDSHVLSAPPSYKNITAN
jgi:hypothetical protein